MFQGSPSQGSSQKKKQAIGAGSCRYAACPSSARHRAGTALGFVMMLSPGQLKILTASTADFRVDAEST